MICTTLPTEVAPTRWWLPILGDHGLVHHFKILVPKVGGMSRASFEIWRGLSGRVGREESTTYIAVVFRWIPSGTRLVGKEMLGLEDDYIILGSLGNGPYLSELQSTLYRTKKHSNL